MVYKMTRLTKNVKQYAVIISGVTKGLPATGGGEETPKTCASFNIPIIVSVTQNQIQDFLRK